MHSVVVFHCHRSCCCRSISPQVPPDRMAHMGWFHQYLCSRLHRCVSSNPLLSSETRSSFCEKPHTIFVKNQIKLTKIPSIGVTTKDRPSAAPQTGDFELGYYAIPPTVTFIAGMSASCTIFVSSAGTSAFLPVISEMRHPKDYNKAVYVCMAIVQASYLSFSLVVYRWCGQWVASPSLGSAGTTIKKVSFGIGLIGLIVSACLYLHVAAKYVFVRILRNSRHLQANTLVHWGTWFTSVLVLATLAFILVEAIPIFAYLIALTGSICFSPLAISLPAYLWLHDHQNWRTGGSKSGENNGNKRRLLRIVAFYFNWFLIFLGGFMCVGGTYAVVMQIKEAYADGTIGGVFSCADNSGSS